MRAVYVVKTIHDLYKVGIAKNIDKRIKGLQTSNGNAVVLVTYAFTGDAPELEHKIHVLLDKYKQDGGREWFKLTPEQAIKVCIYLHQNAKVYYDEGEIKGLLDEYIALHSQLVVSRKSLEKISERVGNDIHVAIRRLHAIKGVKTMPVPKQPKAKPIPSIEQDLKMVELAINVIKQTGKASTSLLQRKLGIGYGRAAKIIDELEQREIVTAAKGNKPRQLIVKE